MIIPFIIPPRRAMLMYTLRATLVEELPFRHYYTAGGGYERADIPVVCALCKFGSRVVNVKVKYLFIFGLLQTRGGPSLYIQMCSVGGTGVVGGRPNARTPV